MIKQLLNIIVCKIKTHTLVTAGACPFTGKSYNACTRCGAMIAI
jgi:hypothetical protein